MHTPGPIPHADVPQLAASLAAQLRARSPRVHCITNAVAQNFTANALLAAGCVPSMTLSAEEIGGFVAKADALLVNLGTFDRERRKAADIAIVAARENSVPWVLDPVFVDRSPPRLEFARMLVARRPAAVRLNHAEFAALAGAAPTRAAVMRYAEEHEVVVALSGADDLVTDGERAITVANGDPLMAKVTAMGCAGSALLAGCLALESDALRAAAAALVILGVAGELAAAKAEGPGSFAVAILDRLHGLDAAALTTHAKVSE